MTYVHNTVSCVIMYRYDEHRSHKDCLTWSESHLLYLHGSVHRSYTSLYSYYLHVDDEVYYFHCFFSVCIWPLMNECLYLDAIWHVFTTARILLNFNVVHHRLQKWILYIFTILTWGQKISGHDNLSTTADNGIKFSIWMYADQLFNLNVTHQKSHLFGYWIKVYHIVFDWMWKKFYLMTLFSAS